MLIKINRVVKHNITLSPVGLHLFVTKTFLTQPQSYWTFPWIQLQTFLRGCLLQITIFILRHTSYLVHLHPCLGLVLFTLCLRDPFFIFSLIFIIINHKTSLKQTNFFFRISKNISYWFWIACMKIVYDFQIAKIQPLGVFYLDFAWFFACFGLVLLLCLAYTNINSLSRESMTEFFVSTVIYENIGNVAHKLKQCKH